MALTVIQSKISPYVPEITQDRLYAAAWAITTVAFRAFSYYAPGTFFFLVPLSAVFAHVVLFNKAIREWDSSQHNKVKIWMITACVVASAFITVMAIRSLPMLATGIKALTIRPHSYKWDMSSSLNYFTLFFGIAGYGGSAAKVLYQRGLELMKTERWEPMQAHMQNNGARNQVKSFVDKLGFTLGLIDSSVMSILNNRIQGLLLKFVPEEQKEQKFNELMADYLSIASARPREAQAIWPPILESFKTLSVEKQLKFLPRLVEIRTDVLNELSEETRQAFNKRKLELDERRQTFLNECKNRQGTLYNQIDEIKNARKEAQKLEKISADLTQLRTDIKQHCEDMKLYFSHLSDALKPFNELQTELMSGKQFLKLQRLNAQKAPADEIDLEDAAWNYFLMEYEQVERGSGTAFIDRMCQQLGISRDKIDDKLNELGIGTIGEFIEKVLGGDRASLKSKEEVLRQLETFIETKNDIRGQMYAALAGKAAAHGSYAVDLAGKVVYKASMLLTAAIPLIVYPRLAAFGAITSMLYHSVPFVARQVDYLRSTWIGEEAVRSSRFVYQLATRRPFFSLLSNLHTGEMATYGSADILGKMRILTVEFLMGSLLVRASFDRDGRAKGLGGLIQGVALGREVSDLGARAWRRISSQ